MFGSFWEVAIPISTALCVKLLALARMRLKIGVFWIGAFHLVRTHLGGMGGGGQVSYTVPMRITCKKGGGEGEGVQIASKIAYVLNGRPHL